MKSEIRLVSLRGFGIEDKREEREIKFRERNINNLKMVDKKKVRSSLGEYVVLVQMKRGFVAGRIFGMCVCGLRERRGVN